MSREHVRLTAWALLAALTLSAGPPAGGARAQAPETPPAPEKKEPAAPDKQKPPDRIGKVTLNREKKYAEAPGTVCLEKDMTILDYLCVAENSGREYESLFRLDGKPSDLHAALLALGARPGSIPAKFKYDRPDMTNIEDKRPPGDKVRVTVVAMKDDQEKETPIEAWLTDRRTRKPPRDLVWIFTGSFFAPAPDGKGQAYMADEERIAAAVLYHSASVLNLASDAGSPYQGEDLGYEIGKDPPQPRGAAVRLRFHVAE
jgi:hypothetical protein